MLTKPTRRKRNAKSSVSAAIVTPVNATNPRLAGIVVVQLPKHDQVTQVIGASPNSIEWSRPEESRLKA